MILNKSLNLLLSIVKSSGARRLSTCNKLLSYLAVNSAEESIVTLHQDLERILKESHEKWNSYDYGEGFFYQSYPALCIYGLRNTEFRFKLYRLTSLLNPNMKVLDIGCNTGFLSLTIAKYCKNIDAFDKNPFLIYIAERCRVHEGIENAKFYCGIFSDMNIIENYDVVLSLANHHTFDGNMRPEFRCYMEKIRGLLHKGGYLIFESHPNEYKNPLFNDQIHSLRNIFQIDSKTIVLNARSVYDNNRIVIWLRAV
jgi:SAM-dependent methyltransferase